MGWQNSRHIQTYRNGVSSINLLWSCAWVTLWASSIRIVSRLTGLKPQRGSRPAHQVPRLSYTLQYDTTTSCSDNKEELSAAQWQPLPAAVCYVKRIFCTAGVKAPNLIEAKRQSLDLGHCKKQNLNSCHLSRVQSVGSLQWNWTRISFYCAHFC